MNLFSLTSFLTTRNSMYDKYIDRRKLTEQNKLKTAEHIVPPPLQWVGTTIYYFLIVIVNLRLQGFNFSANGPVLNANHHILIASFNVQTITPNGLKSFKYIFSVLKECPNGVLTEEIFRTVFQQFFPIGGKSKNGSIMPPPYP